MYKKIYLNIILVYSGSLIKSGIRYHTKMFSPPFSSGLREHIGAVQQGRGNSQVEYISPLGTMNSVKQETYAKGRQVFGGVGFLKNKK